MNIFGLKFYFRESIRREAIEMALLGVFRHPSSLPSPFLFKLDTISVDFKKVVDNTVKLPLRVHLLVPSKRKSIQPESMPNVGKYRLGFRFDGKWVLVTNTEMLAAQVALKHKELWRVERAVSYTHLRAHET